MFAWGIEKRKDDFHQKLSEMRILTFKPKRVSTKKGNAYIFLYKKAIFLSCGFCRPALPPTQTF